MATCSVRYEPHLSDKARSSEVSRLSNTKIWYAYICYHGPHISRNVAGGSQKYLFYLKLIPFSS